MFQSFPGLIMCQWYRVSRISNWTKVVKYTWPRKFLTQSVGVRYWALIPEKSPALSTSILYMLNTNLDENLIFDWSLDKSIALGVGVGHWLPCIRKLPTQSVGVVNWLNTNMDENLIFNWISAISLTQSVGVGHWILYLSKIANTECRHRILAK